MILKLIANFFRTTNFILPLLISFVIIRLITIYTSSIGFDPYDSPSYFQPTWSNPMRMPFISYSFSWISYFGGIVLTQSVIAILSWCYLAWNVSTLGKTIFSKNLSVLLITSLGLTSPVVEHDLLILSESLTISIFNFIIGSLILYGIKNQTVILLTTCLFLIFYSGLKQSNSYFSIVIVIFMVILVLKSNKANLRKKLISLFILVLTTLANLFLINIGRQNDIISNQVLITNVIERTYDDFSSQKWWLNLGLPAIAYQKYTSPYTLPPINMTRNSPQIKAWESGENNLLLEKSAFSNINYLVFAPLNPKAYVNVFTDYESIFTPLAKGTRLDTNYSYLNLDTSKAQERVSLNLPLTLWWSDNSFYSKFLLLIFLVPIILFLFLQTSNRYKFRNTNNFVQFFVLFFFLNVWAIWHISVTYELTRYLLPWAIFLRIISVISLIYSVDMLWNNKLKSKQKMLSRSN